MSSSIVRYTLAALIVQLVVCLSLAHGDEVGDQYAVAVGHYTRQRWQLASKEFDVFLRRFPSHAKANTCRFFLAEALLQQHRAEEAIAAYDEYLRLAPQGTYAKTARFRAGEAAFLAGQHEKARRRLEAFHQALPHDPLTGNVLLYLGQIALAQNDHSKADAYFEQALDKTNPQQKPLIDEIRRAWATSLLALGKNAPAVDLLEAYLADRAEGNATIRPTAQLVVGLARLGKWQSAEANLQNLLDRHPNDPVLAPTVEQTAETAYAASDWPRAARWFTWLIDHGQNKSRVNRALAGLGWSQFKQNQTAESAATYKRLLDRNPKPRLAIESAWIRGHILEQLGQTEEALATYRLVLDTPQHETSHEMSRVVFAAARAYQRTKQFDQADALYKRLEKEYPSHPTLDTILLDTILHERSLVLFDLNRPNDALACLARLYKEYPKSRYAAGAGYRLAEHAAATGDRTTARRLLDEILQNKPPKEVEPYALALACQVDADAGRWPQVHDSAERLLEKYPDLKPPVRLAAQFWAAESLYQQQKYKAAAKPLDRLLKDVGNQHDTWLAMVPLRRAQIYAVDKKWTDAYELASTIEKQFPGFKQQYEVDYLAGRCLAARAEFEAARAAYRRVIHSPQGNKTETAAMAQWMTGETYFHQQDFEAAVREYLRVEILYDYPRWQAAALLQAGKCHDRLNRPAEAAKLYRRLVQDYPVSPFVEQAKKRLAAEPKPKPLRQAQKTMNDNDWNVTRH